jgi:hypothetical protein
MKAKIRLLILFAFFALFGLVFSEEESDGFNYDYSINGLNKWYYSLEVGKVSFSFIFGFDVGEKRIGTTIYTYYNFTCSKNGKKVFSKTDNSGNNYGSNLDTKYFVLINNIPLDTDNCDFSIDIVRKDDLNGKVLFDKKINFSFNPKDKTAILDKNPAEGWDIKTYFDCGTTTKKDEIPTCELSNTLDRPNGELFSTKGDDKLQLKIDFKAPQVDGSFSNGKDGAIMLNGEKIEYIDWNSLKVDCDLNDDYGSMNTCPYEIEHVGSNIFALDIVVIIFL